MLKEDNKNAFDYANIAIKVNYKNHKNHFVLAKVYYKYNLLYSAVKELDNAIQLKFKNYHSEYDEAILLKRRNYGKKVLRIMLKISIYWKR